MAPGPARFKRSNRQLDASRAAPVDCRAPVGSGDTAEILPATRPVVNVTTIATAIASLRHPMTPGPASASVLIAIPSK